MGMTVTVEAADKSATAADIEEVFSYFGYVDRKFSTYKTDSEISRINSGFIRPENYSRDMSEVLVLSEETRKLTEGYFNILTPHGKYDPSGLVKGWAINNASKILQDKGFKNFYVEAGGDIQTQGKNQERGKWSIGIKNPFSQKEIVKVVYLSGQGMATSGTYIRGQHIYNPLNPQNAIADIVSLSVIGTNVYEADRFATAAFAMGKQGINFIEKLPGFEGYMIDKDGMATMTSNFEQYLIENNRI